MSDLTDLSDATLLKRWNAQECTGECSCAQQDELADEIERRWLDI